MREEVLNDNKDITANSKQIELLKEHFPQCFDKEGHFIPHRLEEIVDQSGLELSKESYTLNWLGKSYARLLANEEPRTLLKEDKEHNAEEPHAHSQNLLIKGDNLEVLKHLVNAYESAVKMIYIDPPYNTGSDGFVYQDNRKFTPEELSRLAGVDMDEAKRILEFTQSKANSHSAWLTFMYPRLYVARRLLKDDGVIFISIDDNEQAQLKLLCDEIFGEENFLGNLIIQTATDNNKTQINTEHEYIISFAKKKSIQNNWSRISEAAEKIKNKYEELKNEYGNDIEVIQIKLREWIKENKEYLKKSKVLHYDNVDEKGVFHDGDIANTKFGGYKYEVIHPVTKKPCKIPEKGFRFPRETLLKMIENNDILFGSDESILIKPKKRLESVRDVLRSIIYEDGRTSSNIVDSLIGRGVFQNPKSHFVLSRLFDFTTSNSDIILDFFAGSGTTAHAVMQLNAMDNGRRKYILIQIDEPIDPKEEAFKKGYKSIFDITKARIEKAAKKIAKEHSDFKGDLGFKIYETIPVWEGYLDDIKELTPQTKLFDGTQLEEEDLETLLTTWKVYDGMKLTEPLKEVRFADYRGYMGEAVLYLVHPGFSTEALKALLEKLDEESAFEPSRIVVFGHNFDSKAQRELDEALSTYANKKAIELDVVVRY